MQDLKNNVYRVCLMCLFLSRMLFAADSVCIALKEGHKSLSPPLDLVGQMIMSEGSVRGALQTLLSKYKYDSRYISYIKTLFVERGQELFTPYFTRATQATPKQITQREAELYANLKEWFQKPAIRDLVGRYVTEHFRKQPDFSWEDVSAPRGVVLWEYLARMPASLKKDIFLAQVAVFNGERANALKGSVSKEAVLLRFLASQINRHAFKEILECFETLHLSEKLSQVEGPSNKDSRWYNFELSPKNILFSALGDGNKKKIEHFYVIQKRIIEDYLSDDGLSCRSSSSSVGSNSNNIVPTDLSDTMQNETETVFEDSDDDQISDELDGSDWRKNFKPALEEDIFSVYVPVRGFRPSSFCEKELVQNEVVRMPMGQFLQECCPDVWQVLQDQYSEARLKKVVANDSQFVMVSPALHHALRYPHLHTKKSFEDILSNFENEVQGECTPKEGASLMLDHLMKHIRENMLKRLCDDVVHNFSDDVQNVIRRYLHGVPQSSLVEKWAKAQLPIVAANGDCGHLKRLLTLLPAEQYALNQALTSAKSSGRIDNARLLLRCGAREGLLEKVGKSPERTRRVAALLDLILLQSLTIKQLQKPLQVIRR